VVAAAIRRLKNSEQVAWHPLVRMLRLRFAMAHWCRWLRANDGPMRDSAPDVGVEPAARPQPGLLHLTQADPWHDRFSGSGGCQAVRQRCNWLPSPVSPSRLLPAGIVKLAIRRKALSAANQRLPIRSWRRHLRSAVSPAVGYGAARRGGAVAFLARIHSMRKTAASAP